MLTGDVPFTEMVATDDPIVGAPMLLLRSGAEPTIDTRRGVSRMVEIHLAVGSSVVAAQCSEA